MLGYDHINPRGKTSLESADNLIPPELFTTMIDLINIAIVKQLKSSPIPRHSDSVNVVFFGKFFTTSFGSIT
jgi:hypothetical protein